MGLHSFINDVRSEWSAPITMSTSLSLMLARDIFPSYKNEDPEPRDCLLKAAGVWV
jgi:hypothetical protein